MTEDLSVIVENLIDSIDLELSVKDIQVDVIYLCSTLHLTIGKTITDENLNEYKVVDFLLNEWIQVTPLGGSPAFIGTVVICPPICYFSGAPASLNNEYLDKDASTNRKTPLVWLLENYEEDFFGRESSVERKSRFHLYFLDSTDEVEWSTKQHHTRVIQPLQNLVDAFISEITANKTFKTFEIFTIIPRVRFGKYVDSRGNEKKIIDDDLSGVELSASFEKYKNTNCVSC